MVSFEQIKLGSFYTRKDLAETWGYKSFHAIAKGIVTPQKTNLIILFVTHIKQQSLTQYEDFLNDNYLYWEGEINHSNDNRIIKSRENGDDIHLFYRDIHHTPFEYMGKIYLESVRLNGDAPISAVFKVAEILSTLEEIVAHEGEWRELPETERKSIVASRIGQGLYRKDLIQKWGGCSVTNFPIQELLRASHIKPWRDADNKERLDADNGLLLIPALDTLFDKGFITFARTGKIQIDPVLPKVYWGAIGISESLHLRATNQALDLYMEYHRDCFFMQHGLNSKNSR